MHIELSLNVGQLVPFPGPECRPAVSLQWPRINRTTTTIPHTPLRLRMRMEDLQGMRKPNVAREAPQGIWLRLSGFSSLVAFLFLTPFGVIIWSCSNSISFFGLLEMSRLDFALTSHNTRGESQGPNCSLASFFEIGAASF